MLPMNWCHGNGPRNLMMNRNLMTNRSPCRTELLNRVLARYGLHLLLDYHGEGIKLNGPIHAFKLAATLNSRDRRSL
jgi:hypothetical protein